MSNSFGYGTGGIHAQKLESAALPVSGRVSVYHPGYEPPKLLLMLPAFRSPSSDFGVPFSFVMDASRIMANNLDGNLRVLGTNDDLTPPDALSLLPPGGYEYRVLGGEVRYPICTSFRAWQAPRVLPAHWNVTAMGAQKFPVLNGSDFSTMVKAFDRLCICCHMVPKGEEDWWDNNNMIQVTQNLQGINSPSNCLTMRADLNGLGINAGQFVFAPYGGTAVCVCMSREFEDFAADYHLRAVKIPSRIHPMYMYARFAWNLFTAAKEILRTFQKGENVAIIQEPASTKPTSPKRRRTTGNTGGTNDGLNERGSGSDGRTDGHDDEALPTDGSESSDDTALESPPLDVYRWTEHDLKVAEELDAELSSRPLACYEEATGLYPGFSKAMRLAHNYRQEHPEVSAVAHARVAHMWEDDDEQRLDSD
ncbi:hypothetical protein BDZ89DRAFT_1071203 [Hymenopellis radicata]|nr:hypothetical protein BDZ89DRAFT_1071203 [Hymenopellis radicata]